MYTSEKWCIGFPTRGKMQSRAPFFRRVHGLSNILDPAWSISWGGAGGGGAAPLPSNSPGGASLLPQNCRTVTMPSLTNRKSFLSWFSWIAESVSWPCQKGDSASGIPFKGVHPNPIQLKIQTKSTWISDWAAQQSGEPMTIVEMI